ncbi:MAG: cation transporter [Firmicutes bacterium HGW-Firmicutes-1]|jgi:cation diffusion facilitator family transporter|nr:MAG: cation transporter [Firmicutes bacterium HGW-Firmicutes-1]
MQKHKEITKVAILGMLGNIVLLLSKLIVGFTSNSQAMIADGLNSAGDVFASLMTYIGNKISSKPGDKDHPYGHGKAEYIFAMIISFSLLLVAFSIFRSAFNSLSAENKFQYSNWLVVVAIGTIIVKISLFIFAKSIGKKYNSLLAMANAQDHRNDVFVSLVTLIGILSGYYNIPFVDGIAGILISFWIAYTGVRIFTDAYSVLMDTNINPTLMTKMANILNQITGVEHIDAIISKPIGLKFLLIVKVSIDANLTVFEGHEISDKIKFELMALDDVDDVVVHVNPAQFHPEQMT